MSSKQEIVSPLLPVGDIKTQSQTCERLLRFNEAQHSLRSCWCCRTIRLLSHIQDEKAVILNRTQRKRSFAKQSGSQTGLDNPVCNNNQFNLAYIDFFKLHAFVVDTAVSWFQWVHFQRQTDDTAQQAQMRTRPRSAHHIHQLVICIRWEPHGDNGNGRSAPSLQLCSGVTMVNFLPSMDLSQLKLKCII